MKHFYHTAE